MFPFYQWNWRRSTDLMNWVTSLLAFPNCITLRQLKVPQEQHPKHCTFPDTPSIDQTCPTHHSVRMLLPTTCCDTFWAPSDNTMWCSRKNMRIWSSDSGPTSSSAPSWWNHLTQSLLLSEPQFPYSVKWQGGNDDPKSSFQLFFTSVFSFCILFSSVVRISVNAILGTQNTFGE